MTTALDITPLRILILKIRNKCCQLRCHFTFLSFALLSSKSFRYSSASCRDLLFYAKMEQNMLPESMFRVPELVKKNYSEPGE